MLCEDHTVPFVAHMRLHIPIGWPFTAKVHVHLAIVDVMSPVTEITFHHTFYFPSLQRSPVELKYGNLPPLTILGLPGITPIVAALHLLL